jgi:hypothetical protein
VAKRAEAVVSFYAEMDEHRYEPRHADVWGAVRRLERLEELAGELSLRSRDDPLQAPTSPRSPMPRGQIE